MNWLHRLLLRNKYYRKFIEWTQSVILPGFGTLPLYTVVTSLVNELFEGALINKASSLAYNFLLAFFPGVIFLFTLIPYIPITNFQFSLLQLVSSILPTNAYNAFQTTIEDIIKKENGQLLSFGFLTALYFATNGVSNLMQAFNRSSLILETRTWVKRRAIALLLTVVISVALLIAIVIMIAGQAVIGFVQDNFYKNSHFWFY